MHKSKKQLKRESKEHLGYAKKYRGLYVSQLTKVFELEDRLKVIQAELSKFYRCPGCTDYLGRDDIEADVYHRREP